MDSTISRRRALQLLEVGGLTLALSGCTEILEESDQSTPNSTAMPTHDQTPRSTQPPSQLEPLTRGRFTVEIEGTEVPGVRRVAIPGDSTAAQEYREGDDPDQNRKIWGELTFDDLEMERAVLPDETQLFEWRRQVRQGRMEEGRKHVAVVLRDAADEPQIRWEFENAWIKDYDPPELVADAGGEVATESVTVVFDEMIRTDV